MGAMPMISSMRRLAILSCLLLVTTSWGGKLPVVAVDDVVGPPPAAGPPPTQVETPRPDATSQPEVGSGDLYPGFVATTPSHPTLVARARGDVEVYASPGDPEPTRTIDGTTILGTRTVFAVITGPEDDWLRVMLPGRPNGSTGWIPASAVDLYPVADRIIVDLSDRELIYLRGDAEVLRATVAVGSSRNPTPIGTFYVTDSVTVSDPDGPWGPAALGLSARSETITEYNGGDGIIGIHGTNHPDSLGGAVSLGCVRLHNDQITVLQQAVPLGTLVEIRP